MSSDMDPRPDPDIQFQNLRAPLDALAAHELEADATEETGHIEDADEVGDEAGAGADGDAAGHGGAEYGRAEYDEAEYAAPNDDAESADQPEEPFIPLGTEAAPDSPTDLPIGAHAAIARSLNPQPGIPRVLRKEARAFFDGAMYAYTEGDLPGARLSFLAVTAIGDPDTAPAAMVFLGVIAFRRRDVSEARMWFNRAAVGPDQHWALVAANELQRLG